MLCECRRDTCHYFYFFDVFLSLPLRLKPLRPICPGVQRIAIAAARRRHTAPASVWVAARGAARRLSSLSSTSHGREVPLALRWPRGGMCTGRGRGEHAAPPFARGGPAPAASLTCRSVSCTFGMDEASCSSRRCPINIQSECRAGFEERVSSMAGGVKVQ